MEGRSCDSDHLFTADSSKAVHRTGRASPVLHLRPRRLGMDTTDRRCSVDSFYHAIYHISVPWHRVDAGANVSLMYKQPRGERVSYRSKSNNVNGPSASSDEGNHSTSRHALKYIDYNSLDPESPPLRSIPIQHSVQSSSPASSPTDNDLYACT